jgi:hypothetical protein
MERTQHTPLEESAICSSCGQARNSQLGCWDAMPTRVIDFTDQRIDAVLGGAPLSDEEREFLCTDTPRFEECQPDTEADLRALNDAALMRRCWHIWADYAQGQI